MASLTNFLENKLVDHIFRGVAYTAPTNIYVGLFTAAPSDTGGGTEVSGGAYARSPAIACTTTAWASTGGATTTTNPSAGTSGTTSNNAAVTWAAAPSGANWGVVTHFALFDASTSGNMLVWAALTTPKTINDGDAAPSFAISALTGQIDN